MSGFRLEQNCVSSEPMSQPESNAITRRRLLEFWWLVPVAGAFGFFAWFAQRSFRILLGKPAVGQPHFKAGASFRVARAGEFKNAWDAKIFDYPIKLGSSRASTPAILIRTATPEPGGISVGGAHFLALSRVCTHLQCTCTYITSPEVAAIAYKYRPPQNHPVLGCACHYSAFDPAQGGKSVSGPALKPLPRLQLQERSGELFAVGLEPAS